MNLFTIYPTYFKYVVVICNGKMITSWKNRISIEKVAEILLNDCTISVHFKVGSIQIWGQFVQTFIACVTIPTVDWR